jgi:hypothetical protein
MGKQNIIPMIYGYVVCLVTVITFIVSTAAFVNAIIDLGDPLYADGNYGYRHSLASYENYKMDVLSTADKELTYTPDDETLKTMFEAAKADKIQSVEHRAKRTLLVNGLLIVLCALLFTTHWIWMRRRYRTAKV